jgi:hypothetical protein
LQFAHLVTLEPIPIKNEPLSNMYQYYPKIKYRIDEFNDIRLVDITVSAKIKQALKNFNAIAIQPYVVQNGDRPDAVSNILYGTPYYEYIILMVNNIENIYDQWPKDSTTFKNYIIEKYGSVQAARNQFLFYYTPEGDIVSEQFWLGIPGARKFRETAYEYEVRINDEKSRIRVLDLQFIVKFESDLQELLSQS